MPYWQTLLPRGLGAYDPNHISSVTSGGVGGGTTYAVSRCECHDGLVVGSHHTVFPRGINTYSMAYVTLKAVQEPLFNLYFIRK
jgi:hypothetical protein